MSEKQMAAEVNRLGALVGDLQRENAELRKSISDEKTRASKAIINAHTKYEKRMKAELAADRQYAMELSALLRSARCPNRPRCNGRGAIAFYGPGDTLEMEPCEWCATRDAALTKIPAERETVPAATPPGRSTPSDEPRTLDLPQLRNGWAADKRKAGYICVGCDGCGWCEGSPAFKCERCDGTGIIGPNPWGLCEDCPPAAYPEAPTRCLQCPRRTTPSS